MRALLSSILLTGLLAGCGEKPADPKPGAAASGASAASGAASAASGAASAKTPAPAAAVSQAGKLVKAVAPTGGDVPRFTAALSAKHTGGFFVAERPHELIAQIDKVIAGMPEGSRAEMPPALRDPAARKAMLGFDATTAAGWQSAGLDPAGGAGMVFDTRLAEPLFVIKVRDQAAALATLNRLGAKATLGATADGLTELTIDGKTGLIGTRAGYTFIMGPGKANQQRAAFLEVLKADSPLAQDATLKRAFSDGITGLWMAGFVNGAAVAEFIKKKEPKAAPMVEFYAERFEALAFVAGNSGGTARLLAGAKGVKALQQLFAPKAAAPNFAQRIAADRVVFRFDLNLAEFFDGVLALIPEQMAQPRSMVLMGKNAVPMAIGASFDDLAALTGHVAVSVPAKSQGGPPVPVVMLGVKDGVKTDALLTSISNTLKTVHKAPIAAGKVGGADGYIIQGPMKIGVVRRDGLLLAGPVNAVEATMVANGGLPQTIAGSVNGPAVFGFFVPFDAVLDGMGAQMPPEELKAMRALAKSTWQTMLTDGFLASRWTVDGRGLKLGEGPAMMAMAGILAAIAVPAFMKYVRRSKTSEASMNSRRMFDGAAAYAASEHVGPDGKMLARHFPRSAPLTPATTACKDGQSVPHAPNPAQWETLPWQALGFSVSGPSYYQYEFVSDGKNFTARALGDLDCDGVLSTFERVGTLDESGGVNGAQGIFKNRELE